MGWALAGTKPHVKAAGEEIGAKFGVKDIGGLGSRPNPSDHPFGLALDFMVYGDKAKGDAIAPYCLANYQRLSIKYVIWYRRIWNPKIGWHPYNGISPHTDHVHVSFNASPGQGGTIVDTGGTAPVDPNATAGTPVGFSNPLDPLLDVINQAKGLITWLTSPQNWLRIAAFIAGAIFLIAGLGSLIGANPPDISGAIKKVQSVPKGKA